MDGCAKALAAASHAGDLELRPVLRRPSEESEDFCTSNRTRGGGGGQAGTQGDLQENQFGCVIIVVQEGIKVYDTAARKPRGYVHMHMYRANRGLGRGVRCFLLARDRHVSKYKGEIEESEMPSVFKTGTRYPQEHYPLRRWQ